MGLYRTGMSTNNIVVDDQLSTTSENPVQNKVITNTLNNKQDKLTAGSGINIDSNNTISADMSGYQKFIGQDVLPPSGSGTTGDLVFKGTEGDGNKDLYRYENDEYVKVNLGTTVVANPSQSASVNLSTLQVGSTVYAVPKSINYSTSEQNIGIKYLDGSDIFQRSYLLTTALSLTSNTWTNAIQSNIIGEIISVEGKNADGDIISLVGRMNSGYVQIMSLMSEVQSLKVLTLRYIKAAGSYDFDENYQQGQTYTFTPTIEAEEFLIWAVKHFISVCKTKSNWASNPTFTYILNNLSTIVGRFMQYKGNNNGIGVNLGFGRDYSSTESAFFIYVTYTNGNKTARVAESYSELGDASKYLWGNESQSSLWATRGEYCYRAYVNKTTGVAREEWVMPEWAYTMYVRYIGFKYYDTQSDTSLNTYDITNYGIHLT